MDLLKLALIHTNDTHSHLESSRIFMELPGADGPIKLSAQAGGFARLDSFVQQVRRKAKSAGESVLFVDAGDTFEGSLYFNCFKGLANVDLFNEMALDYMAIGNHELDDGDSALAGFIGQANFPVIATNMVIADQGDTPLTEGLSNLYCQNNPHQSKRYQVCHCNGVAVGIIALSFSNMHDIARPSEALSFECCETAARQAVAELKAQGVNIIVLLSHLGIEQDRQLAERVPGLSVIVGGHSHILQGDFSAIGWEVCAPYADANPNVPIVHAGFHATAAGVIHLQFDDQGQLLKYSGGNTLLLDRQSLSLGEPQQGSAEQLCVAADYLAQQPNVAFVEPSARIEAKLKRDYRPAVTEFFEKELCHIKRNLRHVRVPDDRGGSVIAPIVARSFVDYVLSQGEHVDVGLVNAGAIRASVPSGLLTQADVMGKLLPFPINLQVFSISGADLAAALHQAVMTATQQHGATGSYPYLSNLRLHSPIENHPSADTIVMEVLNTEKLWVPVHPDQLYRVVTTSYVAEGKEGFSCLNDAVLDRTDFPIRAAEVFAWYAQHTLANR